METRILARGSTRNYEHLSQRVRLAKAALASYDLPDARFGIFREEKYPLLFRVFSPSKGNLLLRMYRPPPNPRRRPNKLVAQFRSEAGLRSQMLWLSDIRRAMRLPVPEPIPTATGSLAGRASVEGVPGYRHFVLLRWIPGEHKEANALTPSDFCSIGSYMAMLHRHAERYSPPEGFVRPRWDWDYLFGECAPQWSLGELVFSEDEMETLRSTAELTWEKLLAIGEARNAFGIIHRDIHPTNFVFHERVPYAIDFDHCGWGYYLYDLARTYTLLEDTPMQDALLAGYQRERPLPENHREILETFVAMRLMEAIHWELNRLKGVPLSEIPTQLAWKATGLGPTMERLGKFVANGAL